MDKTFRFLWCNQRLGETKTHIPKGIDRARIGDNLQVHSTRSVRWTLSVQSKPSLVFVWHLCLNFSTVVSLYKKMSTHTLVYLKKIRSLIEIERAWNEAGGLLPSLLIQTWEGLNKGQRSLKNLFNAWVASVRVQRAWKKSSALIPNPLKLEKARIKGHGKSPELC